MRAPLVTLAAGLLWAVPAPAGRADPPTDPPAVPAVADALFAPPSAGPVLFADYLLVRARRDDLALGVVGDSATAGGVESIRYQSANGFRVGAGARLPGDGFDATAAVVYFHTKSQRTVDAPGGALLYPAAGLLGRPAGSADADAGLSAAVTDLDLGRTFAPADALSVRVSGGARFARLDQTFKTIYSGGQLLDAQDYVSNPVRFAGGGLAAGGEATARVGRGFGVYGRARVALLAGEFTSRLTETLAGAAVADLRDTSRAVVPVADLGAGVVWRGRRVFAAAGYDVSNFFNVVDGLAPGGRPGQVVRHRGDLGFETLTLRAGFSY